jgi:uncharacterized membrane protein YvbJ
MSNTTGCINAIKQEAYAQMKCKKCGTDNPQGKNVCTKCGTFLYSQYPNNRIPMTPEQKKQRRLTLFKAGSKSCLFSIGALIILFIVMALISWLMVRFLFTEDFFKTASDAMGTTTT